MLNIVNCIYHPRILNLGSIFCIIILSKCDEIKAFTYCWKYNGWHLQREMWYILVVRKYSGLLVLAFKIRRPKVLNMIALLLLKEFPGSSCSQCSPLLLLCKNVILFEFLILYTCRVIECSWNGEIYFDDWCYNVC